MRESHQAINAFRDEVLLPRSGHIRPVTFRRPALPWSQIDRLTSRQTQVLVSGA
ncbi:hypothetical protein SAMN05519104_8280 [Rhizobiales bacterium GAS188]|nr:hypothetical protein SAMN05519104_8280 [Rhizobiales bacterium GAS188]